MKAIVAHDLRQPVGVLSLMAQTLARRDDSVIGRKDVERLGRAATALDRMISDLQDASRVQTRRLTIRREELAPGPFLREVVDRIRPQLEGFQVEVEERGPPCTARVDAARVEQVLGNLLGNAAKYGEPGTEIRVRVEYREDAVEVTVTNSGVGIPEDDLPKIFDRFFRGREVREGSKSGLGVGLYISRGLVEAHGGRMWAESVPGEKTTFHFTLPLVPAEAMHADERTGPPPGLE
jgi:signal transduction histidine kinase